MSVASAFAKAIPSSLDALSTNEWAITEARARVLVGVSSGEAFDGIVDVLNLASAQSDSYAFASCCWLASALAELSETTERPIGLDAALTQIAPLAVLFGCAQDLEPILRWYRYAA